MADQDNHPAMPTNTTNAADTDLEKNTQASPNHRKRSLAQEYRHFTALFTTCIIASYPIVCTVDYFDRGHVSWVLNVWIHLGMVKKWWCKGKDDAKPDLEVGENEKGESVEIVENEKVDVKLDDVKEHNEA
ncbi:hypothetical protein DL98DRAFT_584873 [Cadophora sp. DSE1049]|nr:hypothetical protein DL98DRAFT_584873 [Cadophora sp. DSE1049]